MKRFGKLEIIAFITGFCLLTYELAAARVLAPSIGSSTYVWTSVIGVIIAALSLGFFVGGKVADRRDRETDLVWLLSLASLLVVCTQLLYPTVLDMSVQAADDVRLQAVLAAILLFAPTSFLIGTTSPYLAKRNVRSLKTTGQHIASLDAFNSLGGIIGTFLTGFVLFGFVGSRETITVVAILLVVVSWLIVPRYRWIERLFFSVFILLTTIIPAVGTSTTVDIDTPSAHYQVVDFMYGGHTAKGLLTGPGGIQSAVFTDGGSEPVFWYTQEISRITLDENPQSILILGGGAFTLPEYLATQLPESTIDVVEIDPELEGISEEYFYYTNPENVNLIFTDARTYVNQTNKTYDLIIADVYGDASIPFSLITAEYGRALAQRVKPDGMVLANVIAGTAGPCKDVFDAAVAAYGQHFPHAYYTQEFAANQRRANFIMIYSRKEQQRLGYEEITSRTEAYTDNHSPSERLYYACETTGGQ